MKIPCACIEQTSNPLIVFKEKKAKITFQNTSRKEYQSVTVDGCVIKEGNKCDFLLVSNEYGDQYFVELKGENVNHAVEQLETSMEQLMDKRKNAGLQYNIDKLSAKLDYWRKFEKDVYNTIHWEEEK